MRVGHSVIVGETGVGWVGVALGAAGVVGVGDGGECGVFVGVALGATGVVGDADCDGVGVGVGAPVTERVAVALAAGGGVGPLPAPHPPAQSSPMTAHLNPNRTILSIAPSSVRQPPHTINRFVHTRPTVSKTQHGRCLHPEKGATPRGFSPRSVSW